MNKDQIILALQAIVTDLSQQADGHQLQSIIFQNEGFVKLADHYAAHAVEERDNVQKLAERILLLGGELQLQDKKGGPIYTDPEDYIKYDHQVSIDGLADLKKIVDASVEDYATYDLLEAYYIDEEADLDWQEKQIKLISLIGKQNWLYSFM